LNPFRNLLRDYGRQYFPKELKGKMDVSDLIQQTLWKAWQSFDTFHGKSKRALAGWLQVIMRHIIDNIFGNTIAASETSAEKFA
jgi:DNA-directed RNA polymerase specialized sigma24 family protein